MQAVQQEKRGFVYHFLQSNYITWFTDWFLGLFGKAAHVILILTTLYTGAELIPGMNLPAALNNTVFLVQMLTLDIGGIGLGKLAMQAKESNPEGAAKAEGLSKWLIRIVIASLVTVAVEGTIKSIPGLGGNIVQVIEAINLVVGGVLTIAGAICAVKYGPVIHALAHDDQAQPAPDKVQDLVSRAVAEAQAKLAADQAQMIADLSARHEQASNLQRIETQMLSAKVHDMPLQISGPASENEADFEAKLADLRAQIEAENEAKFEAKALRMRQEFEARFEAVLRQSVTVSEVREIAQLEASKSAKNLLEMGQKGSAPKSKSEAKPGAPLLDKRATVVALAELRPELSSYEIADETGVPVSTVQRYLKERKEQLSQK